MSSPVGHSIAGWAVQRAFGKDTGQSGRTLGALLLFIVGANAPDLDFIPGLLLGDPNRFHHGISHSLGFMLLLACVAGGLGGWRLVGSFSRFIGVFCALYGSHLILDYLTADGRAPFGIPIFWPLSQQSFGVAWPIFSGIRHEVPGADVGAFLRSSFSLYNAGQALVEICVLAPLALAAGWTRRRLRRSKDQGEVTGVAHRPGGALGLLGESGVRARLGPKRRAPGGTV